jgi:D-amino peptidase
MRLHALSCPSYAFYAFYAFTPGRVEAQAPRAMKVFISVDMEGIAGVVTGEQLGPQGFEYQRAREWMTLEALAASRAPRRPGATEIIIATRTATGRTC